MRIVFIGTGEIGVPTLRALQHSSEHELTGVVTQPDKPVGRDQKITAAPIKAALTGALLNKEESLLLSVATKRSNRPHLSGLLDRRRRVPPLFGEFVDPGDDFRFRLRIGL